MGQVTGKAQLIQIVRDKIQAQGTIPFDEYMELCLYHPEYGYYTSDHIKLGREGDFYTSTSIGDVMGEILADYVVESILGTKPIEGEIELVEWGGGNGQLARQILDAFRTKHTSFYEHLRYICVEKSPFHRTLQRKACADHLQHVHWKDETDLFSCWSKQTQISNPVIVLSNELLDAFPVRRAVRKNHAWHELRVGWKQGNDRPHLEVAPLSGELKYYLAPYTELGQEGQQIEISLQGLDWYQRLASALPEASTIITIDYGDVREELWATHRMNGTLMCYFQHQADDDPFERIGQKDMTAHVNFSDLMQVGQENGLKTERFETQKQFLIETGILSQLQNHNILDPFHPIVRKNRSIRQLLLSDGMSELFKVLVQNKTKAYRT